VQPCSATAWRAHYDQQNDEQHDRGCHPLSSPSSGILSSGGEEAHTEGYHRKERSGSSLSLYSSTQIGTGRSERTHTEMNSHISTEEQLERETSLQTIGTETDTLARCGFTAEEIVAFLWLRRWYETGGSDRMQLLRHWEFLKWLVKASLLEE
jgi:hypothetical protein